MITLKQTTDSINMGKIVKFLKHSRVFLSMTLPLGFFLFGCNLSSDLMKLASQYTASPTFFEQAQLNLRIIWSDCDFKKECFKKRALDHLQNDLCPFYQDYNFVSEKECNRAGSGVMDLILGNTELAVPSRMYELEKEALKQRTEDFCLLQESNCKNTL